MAFPNDLYVASTYSGNLYKYVDDELVSSATVGLGSNSKPQAVFVAQDQRSVYTANRENNTISYIKDGVNEGYVTVGKQPYSICEDGFGAIYVTCYGDSTVYKIEKTVSDPTTITAVINVDSGPTGICCDSDNTVWVACANKGTVCKIVNNKVVLKIPCADATVDNSVCRPMGICCDRLDNIYVACYGTSSVIKIRKSVKIQTLTCDNTPFDVITDSNNNLFVCSYLADTVTYYPLADMNNPTVIQLPAGTGATAMGINKANELYVIGSLSNQIIKIKNSEIVMTKTTQTITPAGFGDPTGCKAYNIYNRANESGETLTPAASAIQLMSAMKLTFRVDEMTESTTATTFTISSDTVKLNGFDHLKLNDVACNLLGSTGQAQAFIPLPITDNKLKLVGYFDAAETEYAEFDPIDYNDVYKIVVGSIADGPGNYVSFNNADPKPVTVVNPGDQVTTIIAQTNADGNLCVLIPTRVAAAVEQGIVVNGMQIYKDWEVSAADQIDISNIPTIQTSYPNYKAYVNPYPAYTGTSVIMNRYKL